MVTPKNKQKAYFTFCKIEIIATFLGWLVYRSARLGVDTKVPVLEELLIWPNAATKEKHHGQRAPACQRHENVETNVAVCHFPKFQNLLFTCLSR